MCVCMCFITSYSEYFSTSIGTPRQCCCQQQPQYVLNRFITRTWNATQKWQPSFGDDLVLGVHGERDDVDAHEVCCGKRLHDTGPEVSNEGPYERERNGTKQKENRGLLTTKKHQLQQCSNRASGLLGRVGVVVVPCVSRLLVDLVVIRTGTQKSGTRSRVSDRLQKTKNKKQGGSRIALLSTHYAPLGHYGGRKLLLICGCSQSERINII